MAYSNGVHARIELLFENEEEPSALLELALGPAESLGDLESVIERFVHAYCLSIDAESFGIDEVRMCLFDPERMIVSFDEDDNGEVSTDDAMSARFAFAFIGQMDDEPTTLDPWLVVRPCTKKQVQIWYQLMTMTGPKEVGTFCLDPQLSGFFPV